MPYVVLGLGSNRPWQGLSCVEVLVRAVRALRPILHDMKCSSVYETAPMYVTCQQAFCNMVVAGCVDNSMSPHDLLFRIHQIEASLGRDRSREMRNGPRSIDIDIEVFGNEIIHFSDSKNAMNNLDIPHPRLSERAFVLLPLLEILGKSADILDSAPYARMLSATGSDGVVKILDADTFIKSV